jgi:hypothetical protein
MALEFDQSVPFVRLVVEAAAGRASIDDVRAMLNRLEERHGVFLRPADHDRPLMPEPGAWAVTALRPFLDDTHLLIAGGDFRDEVDILDREGRELQATWRAWGGYVADWANDRRWNCDRPEGRRWTYLDFYMDGYRGTKHPGYREYVDVVLRAVGVD